MGKKTLYHPVSLHVLRGAVEYCGFKFGRLQQINSDPTGLTATYRAVIEKAPKHCEGKSLEYVHFALQECFNADIKVLTVSATSHGAMTVRICSRIPRDPEQSTLPEPQPEIAPIEQ